MSEGSEAPSKVYVCPGCGQQVAATTKLASNIVTCPSCGREFFIGEDDSDEMIQLSSDDRRESEAEFDALRIRQMVVLRRGLNRSRAYALIAAVVCAAGAVQSGWLAWRQVRVAGGETRATFFIGLMVIAIAGTVWLARRARALHHEMQRSHQPEPTVPPDFSKLGDGSQQAQNLNQIR